MVRHVDPCTVPAALHRLSGYWVEHYGFAAVVVDHMNGRWAGGFWFCFGGNLLLQFRANLLEQLVYG